MPNKQAVMADAYAKLVDRLTQFGKRPRDAVEHLVKFLGAEMLRQHNPPISELVDRWRKFKLADTGLSKKTVTEIRYYARFIKSR